MTSDALTVQVDGGRLEGVRLDGDVRAWLGVPFAAPPVRELRWRAPAPVVPWTGTRAADRVAPMPLQPQRYRTMNHYFGNEATSEDCLYLNVWAPAVPDDRAALPVAVWIYGGEFRIGSASMANYSGHHLALRGVIQVNIAYRVGNLGFLSHLDLTAEGQGASGNYGLLDQIAALEWVQRNIGAFGGDPDRVTVMGQSAGSVSVGLLQSSAAARGLFHRVVAMSGSPFGMPRLRPLADAENDGIEFAEQFGARDIEALRDVGGDRIAAAPAKRRSPIVRDGRVLTASPEEAFAAGTHVDVPAMVGYTRDEAFRSLGSLDTVAEFEDAVRRTFPTAADDVLAAYPAATDDAVARAKADIERDSTLGRQTAAWAHAQTSPTYVWFFTRRHPYAPDITFSDHDPATAGAYHTGDVPYWLGTLDALNLFRRTRDWGAADAELSEAMQSALVSFISRGSPGHEWPAFDPSSPTVMHLGDDRGQIPWPNHDAFDALGAGPGPAAVPDGATPTPPRD